MTDAEAFADLIRKVRQGDSAAAAALVKLYEPEIRRIVRVRLGQSRWQRLFDSMDICQSVMANFFARAAAGQWELESPSQVLRLLATMARNKLRDRVRRQNTLRRGDGQLGQDGEEAMATVPDRQADPSQLAADRELLTAVRARLTDEEKRLVDLRGQGHGWPEMAELVGENAEVLRKRLTRALDRVAGQLGLDALED